MYCSLGDTQGQSHTRDPFSLMEANEFLAISEDLGATLAIVRRVSAAFERSACKPRRCCASRSMRFASAASRSAFFACVRAAFWRCRFVGADELVADAAPFAFVLEEFGDVVREIVRDFSDPTAPSGSTANGFLFAQAFVAETL